MTTYLSELLGKPVWDSRGERIGRCVDVLVAEVDTGFPKFRALATDTAEGRLLVGAEHVAWLKPSIILNTAHPKLYHERGDELWLARDVLDRQIVDTEGRRLVRANDLQMAPSCPDANGGYCLAGVDVGTRGLLRRMGIEAPAAAILKALKRDLPAGIIPWSDVAPLQADEPIRLRISHDRIGELPPADIADIVVELDRPMGQALLETLDDETLADTIEEVDPDLQAALLGSLSPERAADVLEEMDPDEAADILADLKPAERAELLELMEDDDASDVEKLLGYPEESAGGIMTTEYTTMPLGLTVRQALAHLRSSEESRDDERMYMLYVIDAEGRLKGMISLRDLVLAPAQDRVDDLMDTDLITVGLLTPQKEVAQVVSRYNLLAVPVVDDEGLMHGIVTVDDALDAVLPTAWKRRLPRFF